jgi:hypothetical protein
MQRPLRMRYLAETLPVAAGERADRFADDSTLRHGPLYFNRNKVANRS